MALNQALNHDGADVAVTFHYPAKQYPTDPDISNTTAIDPDVESRHMMKSMLSMIVMWNKI